MIKNIEYRNFLLPKGNKITVTTKEIIKTLVDEGKIIPVYGGKIDY